MTVHQRDDAIGHASGTAASPSLRITNRLMNGLVLRHSNAYSKTHGPTACERGLGATARFSFEIEIEIGITGGQSRHVMRYVAHLRNYSASFSAGRGSRSG